MTSHCDWSLLGKGTRFMNIAIRARGTNVFHIELETIERLRKFHKDFPDISQEFLNRELNRALNEMVSRMEQEYFGQELSSL
jgi:hypothetical protein